jgi:two-component system chemotaxis response regulator CheY
MRTVLVVDDSPTMRRMVMATLRKLDGVRFDEASNGLEAIERLTLKAIDLMVLDLNMPDMHGLEVVQFVRSHHQFRDLPIIILTTRGDEPSRATLLVAGASSYMTKPFDPAAMTRQVAELLRAGPSPDGSR